MFIFKQTKYWEPNHDNGNSAHHHGNQTSNEFSVN